MLYEQESIKLLDHLGLLGQRPDAYIRLMNRVLSELTKRNGLGEVPLPQNNDYGLDGSSIKPTNFLNSLESLPSSKQLLTVTRSDGKLHWFHDNEVLVVNGMFDIDTELDNRKAEHSGFRKAHSVSLNSERILEFMQVTGLSSSMTKLSIDTEFLRHYYSSMRIHRNDEKSFVILAKDTPSALIKLLPFMHEGIYRDVISEIDDQPVGPHSVRIYGARWHNLPRTDRKNWTLLNWRNKGIYPANELIDLDINSCALSVVSNHFGYDSHEMVAKLSNKAFESGLVPIKGFTRKQLKFMVNSIIHGGYQRPASSAIYETEDELPNDFEGNKAVVEQLCDYLPPLKHVIGFHNNCKVERVGVDGRKYKVIPKSAKLHFMIMYQQVESDWAMKMLRFADDNKLSVLTFHDGFTLPKEQLQLFQSYSNLVLPSYLSTSVDPFVENETRDSEL
jgi:hypothetical protein